MNEERQQQQLDKMIELLFELHPAFRDLPLDQLTHWLRKSNFNQDQIYAICILSKSIVDTSLKEHRDEDH